MRKLKTLTAVLSVMLIMLASCGQDETLQEVEQNIEIKMDPDDGNSGNQGGGMGGD